MRLLFAIAVSAISLMAQEATVATAEGLTLKIVDPPIHRIYLTLREPLLLIVEEDGKKILTVNDKGKIKLSKGISHKKALEVVLLTVMESMSPDYLQGHRALAEWMHEISEGLKTELWRQH